MELIKKVVSGLEYLTDACLFLLCLAVFSSGAYAIYDSCMVYSQAKDVSLLKYKPEYELPMEEEKRIPLEHMVAWLTLEDTPVDFPVMQGKDNMEYLNKDPYGQYSLAGSIFLDSRNQPDFSDPYSLIYGHHMEHGSMFGALDRFLDETYFFSHREGTLTVGEEALKIRTMAVVETGGEEEAVFAPTENDSLTLPFIEEHALYRDHSVSMGKQDRLIALSTCKYPDTSDRIIVFCVLMPNE